MTEQLYLFTHVPLKVKEAGSSTATVVSQSPASPDESATILPERFDQVHTEFVASLSESQIRRQNGRLERGLLLAKQGLVQIFSDVEYSVKGNYASWYFVNIEDRTCECPDHRNGNACKHRYAAWLIKQVVFNQSNS